MKATLYILLCVAAACICFNAVEAENIAQGVRVVVIDAGHGGSGFPGARYRGVCEKDINLAVALKLGRLIETEMPEIKVVYTRKTDMQFSSALTEDLQARADIANRAEGDLFISIHSNAARSTSAKGVETLIMGESPMEQRANENVLFANNKEEFLDMSDSKTAAVVRAYIQNLQFTYGEYSEAMARFVQQSYVDASRLSRGVKRQPLKVLYATDMPGVLTEIGFMSNAEEMAYITSEKGQSEIARTIFNAFKRYTEYVRNTLLIEEGGAATVEVASSGAASAEPSATPEKSDAVADKEPSVAKQSESEREKSASELVKPKNQRGEESVKASVAEKRETDAQRYVNNRVVSVPTPDVATSSSQSRKSDALSGYSIQLLSSTRIISSSDAMFKSYRGRVLRLIGEGVYKYKYCVGQYDTRDQATVALPQVRRTFKDAFVVQFNGNDIVK